MNPVVAVLVSGLLSTALSVAIVLFLRQPLFSLLIELCGNAARARFWAAFSLLFMVLSTLLGVLVSLPESNGTLKEYQVMALTLTSFRAGVVGLLLALVAIAFILLSAIRKYDQVDPRRPQTG